jgi:hypothetical protein
MVSNAEAETRKIEEERRRHEAALRERLNLKPDEQVNAAKCVEHANKAIAECGLGSIVSFEEIAACLCDMQFLLYNYGDISLLRKSQSLVDEIQEIPSASAVLSAGNSYANARRGFLDKELALKGYFCSVVLEKGSEWIERD